MHEGSLAVVIDPAWAEFLGINLETPLEVTTDGQKIVITPQQSPERRAKFEEALKKVTERYDIALRRLAE
jgi:hypothetical protein